MARSAKKLQLATSGEELGEQVLQSVREMKAGLRGRVIGERSTLTPEYVLIMFD